MDSDKRFNRRIATSRMTSIEVDGKSYEADTINVSQTGLLVETDAPLEIGTRVIWGDKSTGRLVGTVTRVTADAFGIVIRPGQTETEHVLKEISDGLLAPEGDPEGKKYKKKWEKPESGA